MNRGKGQVKTRLGGYTIVETLIFLAVSASMFLMALNLIRGQQNKTEFTNSVREMETRLVDLTNNMSTGYYHSPANFTCSLDGSGKPKFDTATFTEQGANKDCILVGTVIKFNSDDSYDQYTMAGARKVGSRLVTNLFEAQPQAVYEVGGLAIPNVVTHSTTLYGSKVGCIAIGVSCTPTANAASAIGIFASISAVGTGLDKQGSSVQSDLIFYPNMLVNKSDNSANVSTKISSPVTSYNAAFLAANQNPTSGVTICLLSGTTDQYALLHLGGQTGVGNKLAVTTEIKSGSTCS